MQNSTDIQKGYPLDPISVTPCAAESENMDGKDIEPFASNPIIYAKFHFVKSKE